WIKCINDTTPTSMTETFTDYKALLDRILGLWEVHRKKFTRGIVVWITNQWDDEMHVIITEEGWALLVKMKGKQLVGVPGDIGGEGSILFLSPEWSEIDKKYLMRPEQAQKRLVCFLAIREIPFEIRSPEHGGGMSSA